MRESKHLLQRKALPLLLVMLIVIGSSTVSAYAEADNLGEQREADTQTTEAVSQQKENEAEEVVEREILATPSDAPYEPVIEEEISDVSASTESPIGEESTDMPIEQLAEPVAEESVATPSEAPVEQNYAQEVLIPSWSLEYPSSLTVSYGIKVLTLETAKAVNIENLGEKTLYLTITCDCVFSGKSDEMPVVLCVDGVTVNPGEAAVYGTVTESGASYATVTLVFSDEGWDALSSGSYSMAISYHSYAE